MEAVTLEQVYSQYHDKIQWYVYRKVSNQELAEDITSDVFIKVTEHLADFDPTKAALSTWIYTITNRTLTDYYRRRRVFEDIPSENGETGAMPEALVDSDDLAKNILMEEQLQELTEALKALPQRERDLIILHYYSQIALKDIAIKMGMSYANVKIIHKKALSKLKAMMN